MAKKKATGKKPRGRKKVTRKKISQTSGLFSRLRLLVKKKKSAQRVKKASPKVKKSVSRIPAEVQIGKVTHYFPKVRAGVVKVTKGPINLGDRVWIRGNTTDFKQTITSMQINRVPIQQAKKGDEIGLLVSSRVRRTDSVYKI